jgi:hypothetical protein
VIDVKKVTVVVLAMVSLMLFAYAAPVMAMTKEPYWAHVQLGNMSAPGKVWMADDIMHMEDVSDTADYNGTLGIGIMEVHFMHLTVNMETGQGTFIATWKIIIGENTLSGTANGKITGGLFGTATGYFRGTQGTGDFVGIEKWGTFTTNLATGAEDEQGTIIYH